MGEAGTWVKWPSRPRSLMSRRSCSPTPSASSCNEGKEISLVPGLERLRREVFEVLDYDTGGRPRFALAHHGRVRHRRPAGRAGLYTSDELPRGMCQVPYDLRGNPEFARAVAEQADAHGTWITAIDDPCLPIHYATVNLFSYLGRGLDRRWVSVGAAQTAEVEDFLRVGRAIGAAIVASVTGCVADRVGRHVAHVLVACANCGAHEASDRPTSHRGGRGRRPASGSAWLEAGDHARVLETMPEFSAFQPEANFGQYLMMAAALGEERLRAPARACSAPMKTPSAPARSISGSTVRRAAGAEAGGHSTSMGGAFA